MSTTPRSSTTPVAARRTSTPSSRVASPACEKAHTPAKTRSGAAREATRLQASTAGGSSPVVRPLPDTSAPAPSPSTVKNADGKQCAESAIKPEKDIPSGSPKSRRQLSVIDFYECPICRQLLLEPITLACGHTACETCLQQYWVATEGQGPRRCPAGCQTVLPAEIPAVNVMLKTNVLERKFPEEYSRRKAEAAATKPPDAGAGRQTSAHAATGAAAGGGGGGNAGAGVNLDQFRRDFWERVRVQVGGNINTTFMVVGLAKLSVTITVLLVASLLAFYTGYDPLSRFPYMVSPDTLPPSSSSLPAQVVAKPPQDWLQSDVIQFLTAHQFKSMLPAFAEHHVTGDLLLTLDKDDLISMGVRDRVDRKRLLTLLARLKSSHEMPDFWVFRSQHRYWTQIWSTLVHSFPRTSLLFIRYHERELWQCLFGDFCGPDPSRDESDEPIQPASLTLWQRVGILLCPHVVLIWSLLRFWPLNPILVFLSLFNLLTYATMDCTSLYFAVKRRSLAPLNMRDTLYSCVLVLSLFPIIPWWLCDILYLGGMVMDPIIVVGQVIGRAFLALRLDRIMQRQHAA